MNLRVRTYFKEGCMSIVCHSCSIPVCTENYDYLVSVHRFSVSYFCLTSLDPVAPLKALIRLECKCCVFVPTGRSVCV